MSGHQRYATGVLIRKGATPRTAGQDIGLVTDAHAVFVDLAMAEPPADQDYTGAKICASCHFEEQVCARCR